MGSLDSLGKYPPVLCEGIAAKLDGQSYIEAWISFLEAKTPQSHLAPCPFTLLIHVLVSPEWQHS